MISMAGNLYLVPTPIGNLEDMTYRAVRVLGEVDLILAEDTRHTQKLLNHFAISTKQLSFHEHNTQERIPEILTKLREGIHMAQVSDAGTPSISDPGVELVQAAIQAGIKVIPLPGANAAITALIASGLKVQPFTFWGFLPRKKQERLSMLERGYKQAVTGIYYESPHRINKLLEEVESVFGPDRRIAIGRELTKSYEEFLRGRVADLRQETSDKVWKGELVVVIEGQGEAVEEEQEVINDKPEDIRKAIEKAVSEGVKANQAIKEVAKRLGKNKREVYRIYHDLD